MLNKTEIQKLFDFTRKKRVRYIDVQVELVDHLASAIEELRSQDPDMSFDTALQKVYARYPITGFNDLIQEKTKALYFSWARKLKSYLLEFLSWPKILWFVLIFMCLFVLSSTVSGNNFYRVVFGITLFMVFYELIFSLLAGRKYISNFLSLSSYHALNWVIIYLPGQLIFQNTLGKTYYLSGTSQVITCILVSIFLLVNYAVFIVFPKEIRSDALRDYKNFIPDLV